MPRTARKPSPRLNARLTLPLATRQTICSHVKEWEKAGCDFSASEMSAVLARQGIPVLRYGDGDKRLDGFIQVTETVYVRLQRGLGAMVVKEVSKMKLEIYDHRVRVRDLIVDLVTAGAVEMH